MLARPAYPQLTAKQFLEFSFSDRKAELDDGVVRVLDGVTVGHATVQGNIAAWLHAHLRGSGLFPYGSSLPIMTGECSVRCADVVVAPSHPRSERSQISYLDDPLVIFEIVHVGPPRTDLAVKLAEYRRLPTLDTLVVVDAKAERLHVFQRAGRTRWSDEAYDVPIDLRLPCLGLTIPHAKIFARD